MTNRSLHSPLDSPAGRPVVAPVPADRDATPRSLRFQLLLGVNLTLGILLILFLVYDYERSINARLAEKHTALDEEAKLLVQAVVELRHHGQAVVQNYLDTVCGQMQETHSPGHHLAVAFEKTVLQARSHHRASAEMFQAMQAAADAPGHRRRFGDKELVVGSTRRGAVRVFVSEYVGDVRRAVAGDIIRRLAVASVAAMIAAVVVNMVLYRTVDRPLRRLVAIVTRIGRGEFGLQTGKFNSAELTRLAEAIDLMSASLSSAVRYQRGQMEKARQIQEHLLPERIDIPGLRVGCRYQPADDVSGDYYDTFLLPDGSHLLCVADVVGHGVPAAMSAAMLKTLLMDVTTRTSDPAEILELVNGRFATVSLAGDFASMFVGLWNPATPEFEYASAGHGMAWLLTPDGTLRDLDSTGTLLGIDRDSIWTAETVPITSETRLLLTTDGVTETADAHGELFGPHRLTRLLGEYQSLAVDEQVEQIEQALSEYRNGGKQTDDVTMILIEFTVASSAADSGSGIPNRMTG